MEFPILQPICIPTKGKKLLVRIWIWITCTRIWRIVQDWSFETKLYGKNVKILIPKDFVFDGASIPRPLWPLLSPVGILMIPGLVHDYAYRYQKLIYECEGQVSVCKVGRAFSDKLFREISIQVNECRFTSYCSWLMLKCFGWAAWRSNRKEEIKRLVKN